jgi:hypothetical protein
MKKTATLVAGLLLVTGTVLATGLNGWDLTGTTVEGDLWLMHSVSGPLTSEGGDLDVTIKATKETEMGTFGVEAFMEDDDDDDSGLTLSYSRTQGNFEVGLAASIIDDEKGNGGNAEFDFNTDTTSDSYLKWNMTEKMSVTYYPWEVADMSWDNETWESFDLGDESNKGGLALAMKLNEGTTVTFKYTAGQGSGDEDTTENMYAFKAELSTKLANGTLDAYAGLAQEEVENEDLMALGALLNMNLSDAMALTAELNYQDAEYDDAAIGAYAKVAVGLADMAEYKPTAYASFKYLSGQAYNLDEGLTGDDATATDEDFMEIEAGLALAQGNFTVTPKVVISMKDETFGEYDDAEATEDMAYKFGVNFLYSL